MTQDGEAVVERFRPTSGRISGIVGLAAAALILVLAAMAWSSGAPLGVALATCFGAVACWVALLRPRVLVTEHDLIMRNMLSTTRLPLAAIDKVATGQVLAVVVGGKRYVSPAIGHTLRESARVRMSAERPAAVDSYPVFVEERITSLADDARDRLGVAKGSPEQQALAAGVRRTTAWPEIAGLLVTAAAFVIWLLV